MNDRHHDVTRLSAVDQSAQACSGLGKGAHFVYSFDEAYKCARCVAMLLTCLESTAPPAHACGQAPPPHLSLTLVFDLCHAATPQHIATAERESHMLPVLPTLPDSARRLTFCSRAYGVPIYAQGARSQASNPYHRERRQQACFRETRVRPAATLLLVGWPPWHGRWRRCDRE